MLEVVSAELYCYSCTSAQSGCGDPIDVRLMHWKKCTGRTLIENYCVKLIEKVEDQTTVTRGCLSDLLMNTQYRLDMPQLRRHGYCVNSRDYQQYLLKILKGKTLVETAMGLFSDNNMNYKHFCYCNDFNGCNHDTSSTPHFIKHNFPILTITLIITWFAFKMLQLLKICLMYTVAKWCFSKRKSLRKAGEWAIVTGASSGIGEAYAEELAKDGLNILLISNDESQLRLVSERISTDYHVETRIVVADFTQNNVYDVIKPAIQQLSTIACLVNNVGMGLPIGPFVGETQSPNEQSIHDIIHCNVLSTAMMTHIVLPKMLSQKGSNPGIINIASYSALRVTPYLSLYSSTKAFIIQLVKCISAELYTKKLITQTLTPLIVYTSMTSNERLSFFVPTAQVFAKSALDMFGVQQQTTGYIRLEFKAFLYDLIPTPLWISLTKFRVDSRKKTA
ncbi:Inactive hydroxysteroid dehydrogenase-like protein [Schistosoma japonicum]|uniref:Inactive hydroxysteroid dehydrogenase-like protein n=1 Tax=Schistosoma japonicum TaxID=6182 RepID=A0A4Z2D9A9_SCHJA|nr:Inactive hydroxysteroid dehydrogenase-like protein [Schistosoma japonicum]